MPRGVFITLEGGDGSGKSTQAAALSGRLRAEGYRVRTTEEPTGTALGRRIWDAFKEPGSSIDSLAELLFFEAARAQHVTELINPALESGEIVLCDRYTDSSIAYQAYGRGLDLELVQALNDVATGGLKPDLTLLFDAPPEVALARADKGRSDKQRDAIGKETLAFHERVRAGYLELARREPGRIFVIDSSGEANETKKASWERVENVLDGSPNLPSLDRAGRSPIS